MKNLRQVLAGDVPDDVCEWIVEFHAELDERDLTPLQAVRLAVAQIHQGHSWVVQHVRSGLEWSVNLERNEVVEIATKEEKRFRDEA
jgi:hypothetical protein